MLRDRYRQLLTAFVDGELSARQRRHVERLLRRSPEARQFLQQLQEDAWALRRLPRPQLPFDFTEPILHTIAERRLTPNRRRAAHTLPAVSWTGPLLSWAAAAAVLLTIGAASYLYFTAALVPVEKTELVRKQNDKQTPVVDPEPKPPTPDAATAKEKETPPHSTPEKLPTKPSTPTAVKPPKVVKLPKEKPAKPAPKKKTLPPMEGPILTGQLEMFQLSKVSDILPVVLKMDELGRKPARESLLAELRKDADFRIELPCSNGSRALQRVRSAAKVAHFNLTIEKGAQDRLKLKSPASYAVYIENVTPDELASFLQRIGAEDAKLASRNKSAEAQFDRLVLTRLTPQNRKELTTLLGVDPTTTDPSGTGSRSTPHPEKEKSASKSSQRLALVFAYNPVRSSSASNDIKRFLDGRTPPRPGTIRVLLVLRG